MLERLYAWFREYPLAPMELRQLAELCSADTPTLNWNIIYLEKKGWVELIHAADCPPFIACAASLTGAGIDLVENRTRFEERFPYADSDNTRKDHHEH
jgi:hypothetical protein